MKKLIIGLIVVAVLGLGYYFIHSWWAGRLENNPAFAHGNGRIEATEINIAARLAGKVEKVRVLEGEKVKAGQVLVIMQTNVLVAQLAQAEAQLEQATASEAAARAKISVQEATLAKMKSELERNKVIEDNAKIRFERYKNLLKDNATSQQHAESAETQWLTAKSSSISAEAAIKETEANLLVVKAEAAGAKANILAAKADIARIKADIDDSVLRAPLDGRIQYRVAEPGEVLSAGGRALNMVDLTDVYITFFLQEQIAGKVRVGSDVRIVLDAVPNYPLPAKVTYVANVAQFTPKTVETQVERQKLMFRVKAHVDRKLLARFIDMVKTGLPGVAWVRLDNSVEWPKELQVSEEAKAFANKISEEIVKSKTPDEVVNSQTGDFSKKQLVDEKKIMRELKGVSLEKASDVLAKTASEINNMKKGTVDKFVKEAKKVEQSRAGEVSSVVEKARKYNETIKKSTVKDVAK